jgi:hypothetical protein
MQSTRNQAQALSGESGLMISKGVLEWLEPHQVEQLLLHLEGLTESEASWVRHHLDSAPPSTPAQRERVGRILGLRFTSSQTPKSGTDQGSGHHVHQG